MENACCHLVQFNICISADHVTSFQIIFKRWYCYWGWCDWGKCQKTVCRLDDSGDVLKICTAY